MFALTKGLLKYYGQTIITFGVRTDSTAKFWLWRTLHAPQPKTFLAVAHITGSTANFFLAVEH